MTRLLSLFGLMRVSEHDAAYRPLRERLFDSEQKRIHWQGQSNEMTAKYKQAVADLEKQAGEIARLETTVAEHRESFAELTSELEDIRPDALAMRRKRQMDRDRRKGNG